jgi:hypothetical protein
MTPKEKAEQLVKKYYRDSDLLVEDLSFIQAKECALIAVEEILDANPYECDGIDILHSNISYWEAVKQEIEKL